MASVPRIKFAILEHSHGERAWGEARFDASLNFIGNDQKFCYCIGL